MMDKIKFSSSSMDTFGGSGIGKGPVGGVSKDEASSAEPSAKSKANSTTGDDAAFAATLSMVATNQPKALPPVLTASLGGGPAPEGSAEKIGNGEDAQASQVVGKQSQSQAQNQALAQALSGAAVNPILARDAKAMFSKVGDEPRAAGMPVPSNVSMIPKQAQILEASVLSPELRAALGLEQANSTNTANAIAGLKPAEIGNPIPVPERGTADAAVAIEHLKAMGATPVASSITQAHSQFQGLDPASSQSQASTAQAHAMLAGMEMNPTLNASLVSPLVSNAKPGGKTAVSGPLSGGDFLEMRNLIQASAVGDAAMKVSGKQPAESDSGTDEKGSESGLGGQNRTLDSHVGKSNLAGLASLASLDDANAMNSANSMVAGNLKHADASLGAKSFGLPAAGVTDTVVQGHVTQGGMAKDRLSSDSLVGLGMNIRNLAPQGGGEIRIKLQPENLGELHLRVVTDGSQVGLRIQASDDRARKIIEQSLSSLQDSLASHQLTLKSVEFTVAQAGSAQGEFRGGHEQSQSQTQQQNATGNQWSPSQQGFRGEQGREGAGDRSGMGSIGGSVRGGFGGGAMSAFSARSQAAASNGRLDVMA